MQSPVPKKTVAWERKRIFLQRMESSFFLPRHPFASKQSSVLPPFQQCGHFSETFVAQGLKEIVQADQVFSQGEVHIEFG